MKYLIRFVFVLSGVLSVASAQRRTPWHNTLPASQNLSEPRSEFVGYDTRPEAERGDRKDAAYYQPLDLFQTQRDGGIQLRSVANIPVMWIDRDIFLHVEGLSDFNVVVDGKAVGRGNDSATPSEFNLTGIVKDGLNNIAIEIIADGVGQSIDCATARPVSAYIYGQPKCRIEDFDMAAEPDSTRKFGVFYLDIALSNSYNFDQKVQAGYDIYSAEGKLMRYNFKDIVVPANGRDTVSFEQQIYGGIMTQLWSSASPRLFKVMLYIKKDGRMIEYIPLKMGFTDRSLTPQGLTEGGRKITIKGVEYGGTTAAATTLAELTKLKKAGVNTIVPSAPQPYWFYDICDKLGLYVIDRVNIDGQNHNDDPQYTEFYTQRAKRAYRRSRNYTSVIGWNLGHAPNGYNMQRAYQTLKELDGLRPVIYQGAGEDWNSDMAMPALESAAKYLNAPAATVKPATKGR